MSLFVGIVWEQELGPKLPKALAAFEKPLPSISLPSHLAQSQECGRHSRRFATPLRRKTWVEGAEIGSTQGLRDENKNGLVFMKMLERSLLGRA